ncbi:MAG: hypothetical protein WCP07_10965, partial [bacterium]
MKRLVVASINKQQIQDTAEMNAERNIADETPLVTVMSLNPIYAYFDIDERTILRVERLIREGKILSPRDTKYEVLFALA